MKKAFLYTTMIILTALISCSDDDDTYSNLLNDTKSYFPSQTGNYWEYEVWTITTDGKERLDYIDSTRVSKEMDYNGKRYFCVESKGRSNYDKWEEKYWLTDSVGYLIDLKENIHFSNTNFTDTLRYMSSYYPNSDRWQYNMSLKMEKVDTLVTLPAGSFSNVLDYRGRVVVNEIYTEHYKNPRYVNYYFAKNVGIVFEKQFYVFSGTYIEYRLKSYRINGVTYPSK